MAGNYLHFLSKRWWLFLAIPVLAGVGAYGVASRQTPAYRATSTLLISKPSDPGDAGRLTNTYAQLVKRQPVLAEVAKRLTLTGSESALASRLAVSPVAGTQLVKITATDRLPDFAAKLANTTAAAFADDNAAQPSPVATVSIARQAEAPRGQSSPNVLSDVVYAGIAGLIAAAALALIVRRLDDTMELPQQTERAVDLPVLGVIEQLGSSHAVIDAVTPGAAEAYRKLRTNVCFDSSGKALKTIVVTSAGPAEGKSTTAVNLASVLAQAGSRVVLVDADLRSGALSRAFDAPISFGLSGLLQSTIQNPGLGFVSTRWRNLQLLPAGSLPANPSELLSSARMLRVIEGLRDRADYVIFDAPSVLAVTDASALAARADGVLLVAEAGRARAESLRRAARVLGQANARILGVVLNKSDRQAPSSYVLPDAEALEIEAAPSSGLERGHAGLTAAGGSAQPAFPALGAEARPLSSSISDLLARMDDTVGLIQSIKPGAVNRNGSSGA